MALTIDDLLNSLENPNINLMNTKEVWRRIGQKDPFLELGLSKSELETFLDEWIQNNPYKNI